MRLKNKHNKKRSNKLMFNHKSAEYAYQRNEEQLERERILLDYDVIRATIRPL
ncbi:MAG TPA: hypothetical protein VK111_04570 [Virgibacillus sp.]|nr:hypothetical protein [Virgibacillus sp.]